jgi:D-glycero-alpha-D-manno-heptose-7-phosphate kinase
MGISFVGGGTDLNAFYCDYPGRVIATTIDKYVFTVINQTPLIDLVSARYSTTETVRHSSELHHTRLKAALIDLGIESNIEIGTFASVPAKTGLGSSSAFSVALLAGLHAYIGGNVGARRLADLACRLEIDLVGEPIGKQDQFASAFGGLNVFQFNPDETVDVHPVPLSRPLRRKFEYHIIVFYTGLTRNASSVLSDQVKNIPMRRDTLCRMSDAVLDFERLLVAGDFHGLGEMLHETWLWKKSLSGKVSNVAIDSLYQAGRDAGAWGGKVLGAGGGGCVMFLAALDRHDDIRDAVHQTAERCRLEGFRELPISFSSRGAEVLFNSSDDHEQVVPAYARANELAMTAALTQ